MISESALPGRIDVTSSNNISGASSSQDLFEEEENLVKHLR